MINQLSVFVENKFGRLSAVMNSLSENNIDISALSLADTSDFGILRLIVDKPDAAVACLREQGVMVKCTPVIAAAMDDKPGGLSALLNILTKADISIEYMYAFIGKTKDSAWTVIRTDDNAAAEKAFKENGINMLSEQDIVK